MISRTTDTMIEELAAFLRNRDGDSPRLTALVEQVTEDHDVKDANGWPILEGARVHVPERPGLNGCGTVRGFGGRVRSATPDCVEVEEFLTFATRSVRPGDCKVQQGESQASLEHQALRRGGRRYIMDRARKIQLREERAARKVAAEDGDDG